MKKVFCAFFIFIVLFSIVSALTIETNEAYSGGESFIGVVSGNFYNSISLSNIKFYRENSLTEFEEMSLSKIDENTYIVSATVPTGRTPGNYSVRIIGAKYWVGEEFREDSVTKEFIVLDKISFVKVSPPFKIPGNYTYDLSLMNLNPLRINISYNVEGYPEEVISLNSGELKKINLVNYGGTKFQKVFYTFENETYSSLVYINLPEIEGEPYSNETFYNGTDPEEEEENETNGGNWWEIIFGGGNNESEENNLSNNTVNNMSNNNDLRTCSELGFDICTNEEKCEESLIDGKDAQCCPGNCVPKTEESSSWSTIGWILLGAAALFLIWFFFFKFSKARRTSGALLKR
ncbi:MAG: hypothetical protein NUV46_00930 [Nanoarchaeota archaeon]|nr:hypothetical protein [Nanoarchaeota archaeon]